MDILGGIVRDAIQAGDVRLPDGCEPEDLVFGLWAINTGSFVIMASSESLHEIGIHDGVAALRRNQNLMLDGYQWKPLSSEVDFDQVMDRVKSELMTMDVVTA
jgi:translation elongation factor EF-1beta